jgi:glycosyltransferase involved in cell wall biosynthesis
MSQPLLSIVVPTYNRAHLLPATLKSLQVQQYRDFEIIIVDDGSSDNTEKVVEKFLNNYTRYVKKDNAERAAARNYGAKVANGKYINFFDSDDLALSNHTAEAAKLIESYVNPEWFHLAFEWSTASGQILKRVNKFQGHELNHQMAFGNMLSCNGVFVRRDILLTNSFNEDRILSASEDYELWMRLSARFPLFYSNVITSQLVDHDQRSVRTINGQRLIDRLERLIHYLEQDVEVLTYFHSSFRYTRMDSWSYVALHLANHKSTKIKSLQYLFRASGESSKLFMTKRFYATIKNILLIW